MIDGDSSTIEKNYKPKNLIELLRMTCLYCRVEPSVAAVVLCPVAVECSLGEDLGV